MDGYIKVYRSMLEHPVICKDSEYFAVWCYLLLNATHKEQQVLFKGERIILKPGQLITGRIKIAEHFKISESKVQRILKVFENEQQIEQQISNKNRMITILKWNLYQCSEQQTEQQVNNNWTTTEQQLNTNKNDKNVKNERKNRERAFFPPTPDEVKAYCSEKGYVIDAERFIDFYESKGWMVGKNKMKDWKAAVRNWARGDKDRRQESAANGVKRNSFNSIPQRDYDFNELEKQLLQRK